MEDELVHQLSFAMMKLLLNWDFWVNSDCITARERLEILYVCRDAAVIELISLSLSLSHSFRCRSTKCGQVKRVSQFGKRMGAALELVCVAKNSCINLQVCACVCVRVCVLIWSFGYWHDHFHWTYLHVVCVISTWLWLRLWLAQLLINGTNVLQLL